MHAWQDVLLHHASSNCDVPWRTQLLQSLLPRLPHHSFGACSNNMGGTNREAALYPACSHLYVGEQRQEVAHCVKSHYKFDLAVENTVTPNYVTEKFYSALEAGTVPVYFGAPDIASFAPPESFIDGRQFASHEALVDHINRLHNDPVSYMHYHAWRLCGVWGNYSHARSLGFSTLPCRLSRFGTTSSARTAFKCYLPNPPHNSFTPPSPHIPVRASARAGNRTVAASEADGKAATEHAKKLVDVLLEPLFALVRAANAPCSAVLELNDSRHDGLVAAARRAAADRVYMGAKKKLLGWSSSATVAQCQASLPPTCRLFIAQGGSRLQRLQAAGKAHSAHPIPPPFYTPTAAAVQQPSRGIPPSISSTSLPLQAADAALASPSSNSSGSARFPPSAQGQMESAQQQVGAAREAPGNAEESRRGDGRGAHTRGHRSASCGGGEDADSGLLAQQLQELSAQAQGGEGASRAELERQLQQVVALQQRIQQQLRGSPLPAPHAGSSDSAHSASPNSQGSAYGTPGMGAGMGMRAGLSLSQDCDYPVSPGSLSLGHATSPLGPGFKPPRSPSGGARATFAGSGGMAGTAPFAVSPKQASAASQQRHFPRILSAPTPSAAAAAVAGAAAGHGDAGTSPSSASSSPATSMERRLLPPRRPSFDARALAAPAAAAAASVAGAAGGAAGGGGALQRSPGGSARRGGGSMSRVRSYETLVALREEEGEDGHGGAAEAEEGEGDGDGEGEEVGRGRSLADELAALAAEDEGGEGGEGAERKGSSESWRGRAVSSNRGAGSSAGSDAEAAAWAAGRNGTTSARTPECTAALPSSLALVQAGGLPQSGGFQSGSLPQSGSIPGSGGLMAGSSVASTDTFLPLDSFESSEASQNQQSSRPSRFQHLTAMAARHGQSQGPLLAAASHGPLHAHSHGASFGRAAYSSGQLGAGGGGGAGGDGFDCRQFTAAQLARATSNYAPENLLGRGSFGQVFKGEMLGCKVAVKRLEGQGWQGPDEFRVEVEVLSRMRHPNIVLLMGCCTEEMALVYEFLPGGTLQDKLGPPKGSAAVPLSWAERLRIAAEVASALLYLHQNDPPIVHRDLKPDNILLDAHLASKIGDVGLARLLEADGATTMKVRGTAGYIDPEEVETCEISVLSDVYALGLILLQLLTGQRSVKAVHRMLAEAASKGRARPGDVGPGGASKAAVAVVMRYLDTAGGEWRADLVEPVVGVALRCAERRRAKRPELVGEIHPLLVRVAAEAEKEVKQRKQQMDEQFLCPISKEVMRDPVVAADGFTYEREHMERWMATCTLSPATGQPLAHSSLTPNNVLRNLIASHRQR
ncbi:unnamed protein product [Closterium sp. Yama58-4]|nr:unnamed protein product [Closterium sp. Yama58-4]